MSNRQSQSHSADCSFSLIIIASLLIEISAVILPGQQLNPALMCFNRRMPSSLLKLYSIQSRLFGVVSETARPVNVFLQSVYFTNAPSGLPSFVTLVFSQPEIINAIIITVKAIDRKTDRKFIRGIFLFSLQIQF